MASIIPFLENVRSVLRFVWNPIDVRIRYSRWDIFLAHQGKKKTYVNITKHNSHKMHPNVYALCHTIHSPCVLLHHTDLRNASWMRRRKYDKTSLTLHRRPVIGVNQLSTESLDFEHTEVIQTLRQLWAIPKRFHNILASKHIVKNAYTLTKSVRKWLHRLISRTVDEEVT